jgi:hypothetical protein
MPTTEGCLFLKWHLPIHLALLVFYESKKLFIPNMIRSLMGCVPSKHKVHYRQGFQPYFFVTGVDLVKKTDFFSNQNLEATRTLSEHLHVQMCMVLAIMISKPFVKSASEST